MSIPELQIELPMGRVTEFCKSWKIEEMWVFGSALRPDFASDSDLDVLVRFSAEADWGLLDWVGAEQELSAIIGRPVDLVERQCVEQSMNWLRRRHILESARRIYVA